MRINHSKKEQLPIHSSVKNYRKKLIKFEFWITIYVFDWVNYFSIPWYYILHKKNLDFTKSFRDLENVIKKESPTSKDEELRQWQISFLKRHDKDSISLNKKIRIISSSNPIITPKNFQIDKVNMQAEEGDFSTMEKMLDAYKDPFIKNDLTSEFSLPPKNDEKNKRLSCAS